MENQILAALKNNKLFSNIPFDELDLTKITGSFISVREGEILFREKHKSNFIYLVVSGEINLLIKQANTKAQSLIFSENDFLGCEEFIANIPRKSTAVALRDSYLIALSKEEIDILVEQNFDILNNIYAAIPENEEEKKTEINEQDSSEKVEAETTPAFENSTEDSQSDIYSEHENIEEKTQSITEYSDYKPVEDVFENETPQAEADFTEESESIQNTKSPDEILNDNLQSEAIIEETEQPDKSLAPEDNPEQNDFSFDERFGLTDSFMEESQQSEESFSELIKKTEEVKPEENIGEFYNQEYKFYDAGDNTAPTPDEAKTTEIKKEEHIDKIMEESEVTNNLPPQKIDGQYFPTIEHLQKINEAASLVNSNIKIDDILKNIVNVACDLTNADRGTLYFLDKEKKELWSKVAMGNEFREIKLKLGEGIAGWVAQSGEIINLENVREDSRFNASFDKSSGYETKSMICFPIKNPSGEVIGVIQLLNSSKGKFSKIDEEFLKALSIHISLAFSNANMVENMLSNERVSSLGKMANFLIQDIKKPILVSKRYAEHLKSKNLSEDVVKIVDLLSEQLNHIADLIQSTLNYSEGQIILRSIVRNINEVLDDFIGRIDSYVKSRNCRITKKFDTNVNVKVAEKQFYQAFEHIIKNACDAMPDGGEITIETKKSADNILISISDSGLGIPESLHQKIFEPFMSLGKREATGLGLSIAKKIIEEHGGAISVKSQIGEGATFTISFPIIYSY